MINTRKKLLAVVGTLAAGTAVWGGVTLAGPASADEREGSSARGNQVRADEDRDHRSRSAPATRRPTKRPTTAPPTSQRPTTAPPTSQRPTTAPPTSKPPTTTPPTSKPPTTQPPTSSSSCTTVAGDPANVGGPGVGAVTVTITACGGTITKASSTLSQSNFGRNTQALPAMDQLVLQYAKTNINMISYSGATYTAAAYRTSLQSAMTKARI